LNFTVLQAACTNANALRRAPDHRVHFLQVNVPAALGYIMRVADPVSELGPAPAEITHLCHCF
jgi:hypothetical protein